MKDLLEQLTILQGAAHAIETSMPALADDCDHEDVQAARDLLLATRRHLDAIEEELGLPEPMPLRVMDPDYVPLGDDDSGLAGSWQDAGPSTVYAGGSGV